MVISSILKLTKATIEARFPINVGNLISSWNVEKYTEHDVTISGGGSETMSAEKGAIVISDYVFDISGDFSISSVDKFFMVMSSITSLSISNPGTEPITVKAYLFD